MCMNLNGYPCSFFAFHLNCVSKSCDHKSCYEEASVLVVHSPKVWNSVIRLCIFQCQFLRSAVFIKFKSQNITTLFIVHFYNSKVSL